MALDVKSLLDGFRALPLQKQLLAFLVLASVLGGLLVFSLIASKPEFGLLYSNLDPEDQAKVITKLREGGIPYKVEAGGRVILVPVGNVYETRIGLAEEGIPRGGSVGFEIFDKDSLGTSQFAQEVKFRRALQGELARTISGLAEVESARVHLVLPDRSPFVSDVSQQPRASVVVEVLRGRQLNSSQINGIVHLVCGSVEGLRPENVSVIDTHGTLLTSPLDADGAVSLTQTQLEYKDAIETNLEKRVTKMLEGVVGSGKAIVQVAADVDFRQIEKNEELYDPDKVVIRSEQKRVERGSSTMQAGGGIPGVTSNMPAESSGTGTTTSPSERKEQVTSYEINKVVSRIVESVGAVKRMSVAVLLHRDKDTPDAESDKMIQDLTALVKSAVGYNEQRGDRIDVAMMPFEASSVPSEAGPAPGMGDAVQRYLPYVVKYLAVIIGVVVLVFVVLMPLLRNLERSGKRIEEIQRSLPAVTEGMAPKKLEERSRTEEFIDLVRKDSGKAAQVVKMWLREG